MMVSWGLAMIVIEQHMSKIEGNTAQRSDVQVEKG
jgi:hypothetical protein